MRPGAEEVLQPWSRGALEEAGEGVTSGAAALCCGQGCAGGTRRERGPKETGVVRGGGGWGGRSAGRGEKVARD